MRIFPPTWSHAAVARYLRRQAMKGFQRGDDPATWRYVEACNCGVNLPQAPNSVSMMLTRDINPDCLMGWHFSICCVESTGYRGYVPAEGEYWLGVVLGKYSDEAIPQPLEERTPLGIAKDVRHWVIECDFKDRHNPVVNLEGLD